MWRGFRILLSVGALGCLALFAYTAKGALDARSDASAFAARAQGLIAEGKGGDALGDGRLAMLLQVQDPAFVDHAGLDLSTAGAGITTLTQSLSKRLGFDDFQPGLAKLRQTGFALGLETRLTKAEIVALFLDTAEMGHGPDGWMTGFFVASQTIYGKSPDTLTDFEFARLIAVMIAPANFDLTTQDSALTQRANRILRLWNGLCSPTGLRDVWLETCEAPT